jgi:hypothetical protein
MQWMEQWTMDDEVFLGDDVETTPGAPTQMPAAVLQILSEMGGEAGPLRGLLLIPTIRNLEQNTTRYKLERSQLQEQQTIPRIRLWPPR